MNPDLISKLTAFAADSDALSKNIKTNAFATILLRKRLERIALEAQKEKAGERSETHQLEDPYLSDVPLSFEGFVEKIEASLRVPPCIIDDDSFSPEPLPESSSFEETGLSQSIIETYGKPQKQESFALNITLNDKQMMAAAMAEAGKSFVLIGAAGTGKTTAQRAVAERLLLDGKLSFANFRDPSATGEVLYKTAPSIAFCAYTRRAAGNLRKAIHKSPILAEKLQYNIMTIHALLEYAPETYMDYNESGELVEKFRFAPRRHARNPLTITHLIVEEASMLDAYELWGKLYDALSCGVQIIFIGDINQLPPVFGPSILNFALVQLPIIELDFVYRNQGIVLENAHKILAGKPLEEDKDFKIVRGKSEKVLSQTNMATVIGGMFKAMMDITGDDGFPEYDPEDCIILTPFNKQDLGSDNINAWISQHLGDRRGAEVYEIIASMNKCYLAVGDRVMCNKRDGTIVSIHMNSEYHGKEPKSPKIAKINRFGTYIFGSEGDSHVDIDEVGTGMNYSNFSLEALENQTTERKQQASHIVTVALDDGGEEVLSAAGDFGSQIFSLGYALTVHKAQGSEWRKVFIILHKEHAIMLYRELFYTAVTRARTKVTIIAKDFVIEKAIKNQRIKGNTIKDKIEYFNSGAVAESMNARGDIYASK